MPLVSWTLSGVRRSGGIGSMTWSPLRLSLRVSRRHALGLGLQVGVGGLDVTIVIVPTFVGRLIMDHARKRRIIMDPSLEEISSYVTFALPVG